MWERGKSAIIGGKATKSPYETFWPWSWISLLNHHTEIDIDTYSTVFKCCEMVDWNSHIIYGFMCLTFLLTMATKGFEYCVDSVIILFSIMGKLYRYKISYNLMLVFQVIEILSNTEITLLYYLSHNRNKECSLLYLFCKDPGKTLTSKKENEKVFTVCKNSFHLFCLLAISLKQPFFF